MKRPGTVRIRDTIPGFFTRAYEQEAIAMRKRVKNNVSWVGWVDWELKTFHGDDYSVHNGSSQNAYLIEEEKTVLIDTVWTPHRFDFVENLKREIDLKKISASFQTV